MNAKKAKALRREMKKLHGELKKDYTVEFLGNNTNGTVLAVGARAEYQKRKRGDTQPSQQSGEVCEVNAPTAEVYDLNAGLHSRPESGFRSAT